MKTLIDTCVIIDFFKRKEPAINYLQSFTSKPYISSITATELLTGTRNKKDKEEAYSFIGYCNVIEASLEICLQAGELLSKYHKSHGVDLGDGIIAATAQVHNLQLATCNIKHFPMIPGIKRPYSL